MLVGAYSGETNVQRGKRRIVVGYLFLGALVRLIFAALNLDGGEPQIGVVLLSFALISVIALVVLRRKPGWFVGIVSVMLVIQVVEPLVETVIQGGLAPSGMVILYGILAVLGALIVLSVRKAFWSFLAFVFTVVLAVVLPNWIEPLTVNDADAVGIAINTIVATTFIFSGMAYFVRQRDRFQQESDDLLHNILPAEIATRLKSDNTLIADDYESASVLFADMVNFTPMSAVMTPSQLIELLNDVFATFDGFVKDLGLEKIRTVGDEYMAAAGVPHVRPDHAHAIAELALRIRDHTEGNQFDGHGIRMRIGINSGPLVAGVVGTHKFSYDLWGDVVNTASRMESEGVPGSIQVTETTYQLIRDRFVCEPRGLVPVKGKGDMNTYLLLAKRADTAVTP
jgi:guanylate cyclase